MTQNNDDVKLESAGDFYNRMGMDGRKWAAEMHAVYPQIPLDELIAWCCNMCMAGFDEAERRHRASIPAPADGAECKNTEKGYPHALCAIEGCLRDSQDMSGWQDISTAPKDGTYILAVICGNHPTTGLPFIPNIVAWAGEYDLWHMDGSDLDIADEVDERIERDWSMKLTHWMPLPKPPTSEAGHEQRANLS